METPPLGLAPYLPSHNHAEDEPCATGCPVYSWERHVAERGNPYPALPRQTVRNELVDEIVNYLRQGFYENPRTGGLRAIPGWKNAADYIERDFKEE